MSPEQAVRLIALRDVVLADDARYHLRRKMRWYAMTFHTPLHVVETLPVLDVLRHYYEAQYEALEERSHSPDSREAAPAIEALAEERRRLCMSPEEVEAARLEEERDDQATQDLLRREQAKADAEARPAEPPPDVDVKFDVDVVDLGGMVDDVSGQSS